MGNITTALTIVLAVTLVLIMGGMVANDFADMNQDFTITNCSTSMLAGFSANNCTGTYILDTSNPTSRLPGTTTTVDPTGNIITDSYNSIVAWIGQTTGISYLYALLSAPSTWLKNIGVPSIYADLIASVWYGIVLFLIISWIRTGDT